MRTAQEIKCLRGGKGYFTYADMANAMTEKGKEIAGNDNYHISRQSYENKEKGRVRFSVLELKIIAALLDINMDTATDFFS